MVIGKLRLLVNWFRMQELCLSFGVAVFGVTLISTLLGSVIATYSLCFVIGAQLFDRNAANGGVLASVIGSSVVSRRYFTVVPGESWEVGLHGTCGHLSVVQTM